MAGKNTTMKKLVGALRSLPERTFRISDIAFEVIGEDGKVDVMKAIDRQHDVDLAMTEIKTYVGTVHSFQGAVSRAANKGTNR